MRFLILLIAACLAIAAPPPAKKTTTPSVAVKKKTIPVRVNVNRKAVPTRKVAVAPAPYRQAGPTPDRYRQIQESLASKGYLQTAPTGVWDSNSIDAMKKFQADQKLDATGKITSKTLISLGLGPRDQSAPQPTK